MSRSGVVIPAVRERVGQWTRGPVFADSTGRRGRWVRRALILAVLLCCGYLVLLGVSLLGGPITPRDLLPWPAPPGGPKPERVDVPERGASSAATPPAGNPTPGATGTSGASGPAGATSGTSGGAASSSAPTGAPAAPAPSATGGGAVPAPSATAPSAPSAPAAPPLPSVTVTVLPSGVTVPDASLPVTLPAGSG